MQVRNWSPLPRYSLFLITTSLVPYDDIIREGIVGSKCNLYDDMWISDAKSLIEYQRMADALAELSSTTGKPPFVFSLCEWGWVCCTHWLVNSFLRFMNL